MHYRRIQAGKPLGPAGRITAPVPRDGRCQVKACKRPHYATGLCQMHYARKLRGKPLGPAQPIESGWSPDRAEYSGTAAHCEWCGAEFRQRVAGTTRRFCSTRHRHAAQAQRARERGDQRPVKPPCTIDGCEKPQQSRGWCSMHYTRWLNTRDVGEAETRHRPGEWRLTDDGYMIRWLDGKQELQHRVLMEEHLGRPLWPDETPHHKNGNRADNRIENLELWSKAQPAGQRVTDKLAYAREIIARYSDLPPEVT